MGLFSTRKQAVQTHVAQQVGVHGTDILAFGGIHTGGRSIVAQAGGIAGHFRAEGDLTIVSADIAAMEAVQDMAVTSMHGAAQTSIMALQTLQAGQERTAALISETQTGARDVMLRAAPVDAQTIADIARPSRELLIGAVLLVFGVFAIKKWG